MVKIYILNAMLADKRNKSLEKKENKDGQNSSVRFKSQTKALFVIKAESSSFACL